jgi:hypothetical protein
MKPYGNSRIQNRACRYGCCSFGTVKCGRNGIKIVLKSYIRRSRKAARRLNKSICKEID